MSQSGEALWPAQVIHVNEDGWVLINRGAQHNVSTGLRLLVVGADIRDLQDLFAPEDSPDAQQPVLRIRRTYELLEVIYAAENCAIAIATRTPAQRRPTVYRGPEGELLVWIPLPEDYSWPPRGDSSESEAPEASDEAGEAENGASDTSDTSDADISGAPDTPPDHGPQNDDLWEEALPLNSVSVGDLVLPAIAAVPSAPSVSSTPATPSGPSLSIPSLNATGGDSLNAHGHVSLFDQGRLYDWMKKPGE